MFAAAPPVPRGLLAVIGALTLMCSIALSLPAESRAQANQAIATQDGYCFGVLRDGRSVATKECNARFNVSVDGNQILAFLPDGTQGCLDGYRGKDRPAEVVGCDYSQDQQWYLHGTGQIQNVASNLCLDVRGGGRGAGTQIISWDCTGTSNQLFRFEAADPVGGFASLGIDPNATASPQSVGGAAVGSGRGAEYIGHNGNADIPANDGAGLISENGSGIVAGGGGNIVAGGGGNIISQSGSSVVANDGSGLIGQDGVSIISQSGSSATYGVQNVGGSTTGPLVTMLGSRRCLDVTGGYRDPGYQLILWDCHGGESQQFTIQDNGEIRVFGLCLDAFGGGGNNGDAVGTYPCHGGANQKWTYTPSGEIRGINNRCLAVSYADGSAGALIILWDCVGHESQVWTRS